MKLFISLDGNMFITKKHECIEWANMHICKQINEERSQTYQRYEKAHGELLKEALDDSGNALLRSSICEGLGIRGA